MEAKPSYLGMAFVGTRACPSLVFIAKAITTTIIIVTVLMATESIMILKVMMLFSIKLTM